MRITINLILLAAGILILIDNWTTPPSKAQDPKPIENIVSKIIDVDFSLPPRGNNLIRVITCEYLRDNSRHYVTTFGSFHEVPYIKEKWNGHLDEQGNYIFDSKIPE